MELGLMDTASGSVNAEFGSMGAGLNAVDVGPGSVEVVEIGSGFSGILADAASGSTDGGDASVEVASGVETASGVDETISEPLIYDYLQNNATLRSKSPAAHRSPQGRASHQDMSEDENEDHDEIEAEMLDKHREVDEDEFNDEPLLMDKEEARTWESDASKGVGDANDEDEFRDELLLKEHASTRKHFSTRTDEARMHAIDDAGDAGDATDADEFKDDKLLLDIRETIKDAIKDAIRDAIKDAGNATDMARISTTHHTPIDDTDDATDEEGSKARAPKRAPTLRVDKGVGDALRRSRTDENELMDERLLLDYTELVDRKKARASKPAPMTRVDAGNDDATDEDELKDARLLVERSKARAPQRVPMTRIDIGNDDATDEDELKDARLLVERSKARAPQRVPMTPLNKGGRYETDEDDFKDEEILKDGALFMQTGKVPAPKRAPMMRVDKGMGDATDEDELKDEAILKDGASTNARAPKRAPMTPLNKGGRYETDEDEFKDEEILKDGALFMQTGKVPAPKRAPMMRVDMGNDDATDEDELRDARLLVERSKARASKPYGTDEDEPKDDALLVDENAADVLRMQAAVGAGGDRLGVPRWWHPQWRKKKGHMKRKARSALYATMETGIAAPYFLAHCSLNRVAANSSIVRDLLEAMPHEKPNGDTLTTHHEDAVVDPSKLMYKVIGLTMPRSAYAGWVARKAAERVQPARLQAEPSSGADFASGEVEAACGPAPLPRFAACPEAHEVREPPSTSKEDMTKNVHLVLGGMMNQADVELALRMPRITHLWLYNNAVPAGHECSSVAKPGVWCGAPCKRINTTNARAGLLVNCVDRPNLGRGEAGLFQHVVDQYDSLDDGVVVFSQSTLGNEVGSGVLRKHWVQSLIEETSNTTRPSCACTEHASAFDAQTHPAAWKSSHGPLRLVLSGSDARCTLCPGQLLSAVTREGDPSFTLTLNGNGESAWAGQCASCEPNPNATTDRCASGGSCSSEVCAVQYPGLDPTHPRHQSVGRAEPAGSMAAWLATHAPGPLSTVAPYCLLGLARTSGEYIRRRPREHYANVLAQLERDANPEASHYIERAMLYLFASV
jgi:hypothetical protein